MDGFLLEKHHILFLFLVFCTNQIFFCWRCDEIWAEMPPPPPCHKNRYCNNIYGCVCIFRPATRILMMKWKGKWRPCGCCYDIRKRNNWIIYSFICLQYYYNQHKALIFILDLPRNIHFEWLFWFSVCVCVSSAHL